MQRLVQPLVARLVWPLTRALPGAGSAPPDPGSAGSPIGLLLLLTKAS